MPHSLPRDTGGRVTPLLLMALKSARIGVAVKDADGRYLYLSGLPEYFPQMSAAEASDDVLFGEEWAQKIIAEQEAVRETGEPSVFEVSNISNSEFLACECRIQRYSIDDGNPAVLITFVDLTPERKREERLRALLREVSHRSKNLLAIVQSIAAQTARTSESLDLFLLRFRGRLAALSAAQDLVTESNWSGADFKELAQRQLARYAELGDTRITIESCDVELSPNGATHVGLALHELIANAVSHGALSAVGGKVELFCDEVENGGEGREFEITWRETMNGSAEKDNKNNGKAVKRFGSTVLERVVPAALNGTAIYRLEPGKVEYRLRFPEN